jgi:hypothetical protein
MAVEVTVAARVSSAVPVLLWTIVTHVTFNTATIASDFSHIKTVIGPPSSWRSERKSWVVHALSSSTILRRTLIRSSVVSIGAYPWLLGHDCVWKALLMNRGYDSGRDSHEDDERGVRAVS